MTLLYHYWVCNGYDLLKNMLGLWYSYTEYNAEINESETIDSYERKRNF